jgi:lipopolysaccharide export system protein LptA
MNINRRLSGILMISALVGVSLAADTVKDRVVRVGEARTQGDPQNGPLTLTSKSATPVRSTVSNLVLTSEKVVLSAPTGTSFSSAEGKRNAEFSGKVTVVRGKVNAVGPTLSYSESSGLGTLKGGAKMTYTPDGKDTEPVLVEASQMQFDVDTETSVSKGNVKLINGKQSTVSETLQFNEKTELAILGGGKVTLTRQPNKAGENILTLTGVDAKIQTGKDKKLLLMTGKVTLVDGTITTTGNTLFYDDKKNLAIVSGNAKSVDSKNKITQSGVTLEHRTDLNRVRPLSGGFTIPVDTFK